MGVWRALTFAVVAAWGLSAHAIHARADGAAVPADDHSPYAPSGFFQYDWSGPYAGGHLGALHTNVESTETIFPNSLEFFQSETYGQDQASFTGGLQAGWQKHWGKLVFGAEVGFSLLQFDTTEESPILGGLFRTAEVGPIVTLTGRLGYADGRWLAYAKGGIATADVDISYRDTVTGLSTSSGEQEIGWTAGVGIDYALTQNWILGVEYNYVHFRADIEPPTIPFPPTQFSNVDVDIQNVVLRLNYRFGHPSCCVGPPGPPYGR
jgi:outer membrane immunogenic protein